MNERSEALDKAVERFSRSFWNYPASKIQPKIRPQVEAALEDAALPIRQQLREAMVQPASLQRLFGELAPFDANAPEVEAERRQTVEAAFEALDILEDSNA
jgi:hypothetical protein